MAAPDRFIVVAVAASAGGIPAIGQFLSSLRADVPDAILIVQHLAPAHVSMLPTILGRYTRMPTLEARDGVFLERGAVWIAPPGRHLVVNLDSSLSLTDSAPIHYVRPSADVLFESVAQTFGPRAIAVVLSGAGQDGAHGCEVIKQHGGIVLVQRECGDVFFSGMPDAATRSGVVDAVLPAREIGRAIIEFAARQNTS